MLHMAYAWVRIAGACGLHVNSCLQALQERMLNNSALKHNPVWLLPITSAAWQTRGPA